jgi:hypothetical protein
VAGNAACLHDDLSAAPDAPVIAVNGAAGEVEAFALFTIHPHRIPELRWAEKQRARFGPDFSIHSGKYTDSMPWVDHWWPEARGNGGGSAWGARKLARLMGFDLVILCGCPLDVGPYVGNHNLSGLMHVENVVQDMRDGVARDKEWHAGVISMSGWTKGLLGC